MDKGVKNLRYLLIGITVVIFLTMNEGLIKHSFTNVTAVVEKVKSRRAKTEAQTAVKMYIKSGLKYRRSYRGVLWEITEVEDGHVVYHSYRAKNSFNAYVLEEGAFFVNRDGVVTPVIYN